MADIDQNDGIALADAKYAGMSLPEKIESLARECDAAGGSMKQDAAALREIAVHWRPRPIDEYHEDMGAVLWWKFPITEPPYVGGGWPGYHTHFTPIPKPMVPSNG